jgi:hypothetical protein
MQALHVNAAGVPLRAVVAGALIGGNRQTDDRGQYRVLGLQPGTYVIAALADAASLRGAPSLDGGAIVSQTVPIYFPGSASVADAVIVTITSSDVEGIDFAVGDVPVTRVTGVALDSTGAPLVGSIALSVSHRSGSMVPSPRVTRSAADGAFTFFNVAPGDYVVQAFKLPSIPTIPVDRIVDPREAMEFAAQYVTVGGHDAEPVTLRTARTSAMEGRIVTDLAAPHDPYDRMQIESYPVGFDQAPITLMTSGTRVVDGRFRILGLTGPRRFVLSGMPEGWYLKSLTIAGADMTDRVIDFGVGASRTVSAEIVISTTGGTIVGRVTSGQRAARAGSVIVFPLDREKWFERSRFIKVVRASQDSSFRVSSLPPGDYHVALISNALETVTPDMLEALLSRAVSVTVNEGKARKVDLSR